MSKWMNLLTVLYTPLLIVGSIWFMMDALAYKPDNLTLLQKLPTLFLAVTLLLIIVRTVAMGLEPPLTARVLRNLSLLPLVPLLVTIFGYTIAYITSGSFYIALPFSDSLMINNNQDE